MEGLWACSGRIASNESAGHSIACRLPRRLSSDPEGSGQFRQNLLMPTDGRDITSAVVRRVLASRDGHYVSRGID